MDFENKNWIKEEEQITLVESVMEKNLFQLVDEISNFMRKNKYEDIKQIKVHQRFLKDLLRESEHNVNTYVDPEVFGYYRKNFRVHNHDTKTPKSMFRRLSVINRCPARYSIKVAISVFSTVAPSGIIPTF